VQHPGSELTSSPKPKANEVRVAFARWPHVSMGWMRDVLVGGFVAAHRLQAKQELLWRVVTPGGFGIARQKAHHRALMRMNLIVFERQNLTIGIVNDSAWMFNP
jgi:hypothetical protein